MAFGYSEYEGPSVELTSLLFNYMSFNEDFNHGGRIYSNLLYILRPFRQFLHFGEPSTTISPHFSSSEVSGVGVDQNFCLSAPHFSYMTTSHDGCTLGYPNNQNSLESKYGALTANRSNYVPQVSYLDYSALHVRMLYAEEGIDYPGDPYDNVDLSNIIQINSERERSFKKLVAVIILNAKNKHKSQGAVSVKLQKQGGKFINGHTANDIINAFVLSYPNIKKYFHSGYGTILQNKDKDFTMGIVARFNQLDEVVFPLHDGYIVPVDREDDLRDIMINVYKEEYGFVPEISKKF